MNILKFLKGNKKSKEQNSFFTMNALNFIEARNALNKAKKEADTSLLDLVTIQEDELFISIKDLLAIIDSDAPLSLFTFFKKLQHVAELQDKNYSTFTSFVSIEDNHIILCLDKLNCNIHKEEDLEKITLLTIKNG